MIYFTFVIKLNKETNKLQQLVSISKDIISSIEFENKNLLREIESLRERQYVLIQNFYLFVGYVTPYTWI